MSKGACDPFAPSKQLYTYGKNDDSINEVATHLIYFLDHHQEMQ